MGKAVWARKDLLASVLLLTIFLLYGLLGLRYEVGTASAPDYGMFPRLVAIVGGLISLSYLLSAVRRPDGPVVTGELTRREMTRGALFALSLLMFAVLFPRLGHVISVFLIVAFDCWLLGIKKYLHVLALGLAAGATVFWVFHQMLAIELIRGPFGF